MKKLKVHLAAVVVAATSAVFASASGVVKTVGPLSVSDKEAALKQGVNPMSDGGADPDMVKMAESKAGSAAKSIGNASISYIGGGSPSEGKSGTSDAGVEEALRSVGLRYTKLDNGNLRVNWTIKSGPRTHLTFVNAKSSNYYGVEMRDVWAIGFSATSIDSNNLQALLELNAKYKLGAWEVQKCNDKLYAVFTIRIPANASGKTLKTAMICAAEVADEIELKATRGDEF